MLRGARLVGDEDTCLPPVCRPKSGLDVRRGFSFYILNSTPRGFASQQKPTFCSDMKQSTQIILIS